MADENIDDVLESLSRVSNSLNIESDLRDKIAKELKREMDDASQRNLRLNVDAAQQRKKTKELLALIQKQSDKLAAGIITLDEFNDSVDDATRDLARLKKSASDANKALIEKALQDVKDIETRKKVNEQLRTSAGSLVGAMLTSAATLTAGILKAVQDGGNGIKVASDIIQAELTAGGQVANATAKGVSSVGSAMSSLGGKAGKAGKVIEFLGNAGGMAANALIEFEKFKFNMLAKQAELVINSYHDISSTGAMFADGMDSLKTASVESGLSIQTLSKIQKAAAEDISGAGLGMAKGFKLMAKTMASPELKNNLLNLGLSLEEQGEVVAKTMEQMRRAGRDMSTVSASDIAESTESYAKNLRTIATITGQDAKAKLEEARKASLNAGVRAKLMAMDRKAGNTHATEKFQQQYAAAAAKGFGDAFMQKFVSSNAQGQGGVVTDRDSNVLLANADGASAELDKMVQSAKDTSTSMDEFNLAAANSAGKLNEIFSSEKFTNSIEKIGEASALGATGVAKSVSEKFVSVLEGALKGPQNSKEAMAATQAVQDSMHTLSETTRKLNETMVKGEEARSVLEGQLFTHLNDYTKLMLQALDNARKILDYNPIGVVDSVIDKLGEFGSMLLGVLGMGGFGLLKSALSGLSTGATAATTALEGTVAATEAASAAALTEGSAAATGVGAVSSGAAAAAGLAVAPMAAMGAATYAADNAKMGGSNLNPFSLTGNAGLGMSKFFESIFGSRGDDAERKQKRQQAEMGATWTKEEAVAIKNRLGIDVPVKVEPISAGDVKAAVVTPTVPLKTDTTSPGINMLDINDSFSRMIADLPPGVATATNQQITATLRDSGIDKTSDLTQSKAGIEQSNANAQISDTMQKISVYLEKSSTSEPMPEDKKDNTSALMTSVNRINDLLAKQVEYSATSTDLFNQMLDVSQGIRHLNNRQLKTMG